VSGHVNVGSLWPMALTPSRNAGEGETRLGQKRPNECCAVARFLEVHQNTWKNAKHRQQWANTLRDYANSLRDRPISAIDGAQITDALTPIWTKKPETARRVKQRIERVSSGCGMARPSPRQAQASGYGIIRLCRLLNCQPSWLSYARGIAFRPAH